MSVVLDLWLEVRDLNHTLSMSFENLLQNDTFANPSTRDIYLSLLYFYLIIPFVLPALAMI
jgi:hypothetical protein